jgi:hypothetical protein
MFPWSGIHPASDFAQPDRLGKPFQGCCERFGKRQPHSLTFIPYHLCGHYLIRLSVSADANSWYYSGSEEAVIRLDRLTRAEANPHVHNITGIALVVYFKSVLNGNGALNRTVCRRERGNNPSPVCRTSRPL